MAEIVQRDGTWTFDGETVRIVPGRIERVPIPSLTASRSARERNHTHSCPISGRIVA